MSISTEITKMFSSKYFLYVMVFLASTNILAYLVTHKIHAIAFFALVCILSYQFSRNMSVVLFIGLLATNLLMSNGRLREGLETQSTALNKVAETDPDIRNAIPAVKKAKNNEDVKQILAEKRPKIEIDIDEHDVDETGAPMDINNTDLNKKSNEAGAPEGFGEKMSNGKKIKPKTEEHFGPRIDYASTIEQSYQNLDNLLGSDSIKQLTTDTQKLMKQQQSLFNTMNQMVPVLEGAQNMLKGFDMTGLTKSLNQINASVPK